MDSHDEDGFCNHMQSAKSNLILIIKRELLKRNLTGTLAENALGCSPMDLINIELGHATRYTMDEVFRFLVKMNIDVDIQIWNNERTGSAEVIVTNSLD
jgi:hypothetical protein